MTKYEIHLQAARRRGAKLNPTNSNLRKIGSELSSRMVAICSFGEIAREFKTTPQLASYECQVALGKLAYRLAARMPMEMDVR